MIYTVHHSNSFMKKGPQKNSERISEAYFSEEVRLLDQTGDWAFIETLVDSYQGWILKDSLSPKGTPHVSFITAKVERLAAHVYDREDTIYGPLITLPFESKLELISTQEISDSRWLKILLPRGEKGYIQRGDVELNPSLKKIDELKSFSLRFLGLPYTWGGRSSFGYDCSGFTQMLYRQAGLFLPRNAQDQLSWHNFSPVSLEELKTGDLLFWGLSDEKIYHVGMYLENRRFIHATVAENAPYIRISYLTDPEWNCKGKWPYRAFRTLNQKKN